MPNWCQNNLVTRGPEETVARFCLTVETGMSPEAALAAAELILATGAHTDADVAGVARSFEGDDYQALSFAQTVPAQTYDERCDRWGTKLDADEPRLMDRKPGSATWFFYTAWSPPVPWVMRTADMWADLEFELIWLEPEMPFAGRMTAHGSEVEVRDFAEGTEAQELAAFGLEDWWAENFPQDDDLEEPA